MTETMVFITLGGTLVGITIIGILLFLIQRKIKVRLNKFQLLAVGSGMGFPIFAILHNVVHALGIVWFGDDYWAAGDESVLFIITLIVCPLGLLVGGIGTLILRKQK
ncbi:hypothetical protein ACFLTO_03985 [Chloroflexota bacterium]